MQYDTKYAIIKLIFNLNSVQMVELFLIAVKMEQTTKTAV